MVYLVADMKPPYNLPVGWEYLQTSQANLPEKLIYLDIETYSIREDRTALDTLTAIPRLVTVYAGGEEPVYVIDTYCSRKEDIARILNGHDLCGHNLFYDTPILLRVYGLEFPKQFRDTMVASMVLMNGMKNIEGGHKLASCIKRYLGEESHSKEEQQSDWKALHLSVDQLQYAANDVLCLEKLHNNLLERLEKFRLSQTYEVECKMMPVTINMEMVGIGVDAAQWRERTVVTTSLAEASERELLAHLGIPPVKEVGPLKTKRDGTLYATSERRLRRIEAENATRKWNLDSPAQLRQAFANLGIIMESTNEETLASLVEDNPIIQKVIDYRGFKKEIGTYGLEWLKDNIRTDIDGRVHPKWWQLGTDTGRYSCSGPNMQQIPRGNNCRAGIIAQEGRVLLRCDYSQIEARVMAKVSKDKVMMQVFMDDRDIHSFVASEILNKPVEQVTKGERQLGKSLVFGLLFGLGARNLVIYCRTKYHVDMTLREAEVFRAKFFRLFHELEAWQNLKRRNESDMDIRTLIGRRRILEETPETFHRAGAHMNTPVQGTAADLFKISCGELWRERNMFPDTHIIIVVHDEVVMETPDENSQEVASWVKKTMVDIGNKLLYPVPCDAGIKVGKNWGS